MVFINRYFFPDHAATSQMLTDLAFFLARQGYGVHVITSRQRYDEPNAVLLRQERCHGVAVSRVWTSRFGRENLFGRALDYLSFYLSAGWRLFRLASREDVVVAKTDPPLISVVAALAAWLRGVRLVNWCQDLFPEVATTLKMKGFTGWRAKWLHHIRNWSLFRANANVVLGELMAERVKELGVSQKAIRIIHNWADGQAIQAGGGNGDGLRRDWGLEGKFIVGYSGNMGRVHEFSTFLDAAGELSEEDGIVFLFIGGGPKLPWVQGKVSTRGLQNVIFKPYQPREILGESLSVPNVHLISLIPEMEGLIVPSKFYGIAAAGCPTIYVGDPEGEIPRMLMEAECGYAVMQGEGATLAKCIRDLKNNPKRGEEMGKRARNLFEERFDKTIAMKKWEAVLKAVPSPTDLE